MAESRESWNKPSNGFLSDGNVRLQLLQPTGWEPWDCCLWEIIRKNTLIPNTLLFLSNFPETKNQMHACTLAVLIQGAWCQQSFSWLLFSSLIEEVPKRWLAAKRFCWRAVRSYYELCYHPVILTCPLFSHLTCEKRDRQGLGEHRMKREE